MMITDWLRRSILFAWAIIAVCMVLLGVWALDRKPPFALISSDLSYTAAGNFAVVKAHVRRDLGRNCSAAYSRQFYDSTGVRFDLVNNVVATPSSIQLLNNLTPGSLVVTFLVPTTAVKGSGKLVSVLEYRCNPLHYLWPIDVVYSVPMEIV